MDVQVKATHSVFHTNPALVHQSSPNVHLVASPGKGSRMGSAAHAASSLLDDTPTKLASFQEFVAHLHDASEHSTSQV